MITVVALCSFLLGKCVSGKWKAKKTPMDAPLIFAFALVAASSLFGVHHTASFWASMFFLNCLVIFYLVVNTFRSRAHTGQLVNVVAGTALFISIFGIIKMLGNNPFSWWNYDDIPQNAHRLSSTFGNPDHLAGYMEMALPLTLGILISGRKRGKLVFTAYAAIIMAAALILSLSRGGWIGAFSGLVFMNIVLLKTGGIGKKRMIASLFGGMILMLLVVYHTSVVERIRTFEQKEEVPTFKSRVVVWGGIVEMIGDHPVLGVGPGNFSVVFTRYQPPGFKGRYTMGHNDYLHFTSELGLPFIAMAIFATIMFFKAGLAKMRSRSRRIRGATLGCMAGVIAILVHSLADFNLHIPANAILFTVVAALVASPRTRASIRTFDHTWKNA